MLLFQYQNTPWDLFLPYMTPYKNRLEYGISQMQKKEKKKRCLVKKMLLKNIVANFYVNKTRNFS